MIARQSVLVVGNSVLGALQGMIALFAIARYMGAEALGARSFAFSLITLFSVVCRLGFPVTHARRLARGEDIGKSNGAYLVLKVILTSAFAVLSLVGAFVWFVVLDRSVEDTTVIALWLAWGSVLLTSMRDLPVNSFRGTRQIIRREAVLFTNTFTTVLLTLMGAIAFAESHGRYSPVPGLANWLADAMNVTGPLGFETGVYWLMLAFFLGEATATILAYVFFLQLKFPVDKPQVAIMREYLRFTLPLMLLPVAAVITKRVSQVMLGFWYDARQLGLYAGAAKISEVLLIVASGVQIVLLPVLSKMHKDGARDTMRETVIQAERWISLLVWPAVCFIILAPKAIIHVLLSNEFLAAAPILIVLCIHSLVGSLRMPIQTKALGLGEYKFAGRVAMAMVAVNIILNFILVPEEIGPVRLAGLGALGAGLAALGGGLVPLFAYRTKANEWTGHPLFSVHLMKHAGAAMATLGVLALARPVVGLPSLELVRFWHVMVYGLLVLATYLTALVALGELRGKDIRIVRAAFGSQTAKSE